MGIQLYKQGRIQSRKFRKTTTKNLYHESLTKLYGFLSRRTDSKFNETVDKRLNQSRITRYPVSVSRLAKLANTEEKRQKILVIVGKVLNDERFLTVPKMRICALKFSEEAREKILKAGGECLTFDQLSRLSPKGENTKLIRGRRSREALKHFGKAPGIKGSHTKPYVLNGNHKKERKYKHVKK